MNKLIVKLSFLVLLLVNSGLTQTRRDKLFSGAFPKLANDKKLSALVCGESKRHELTAVLRNGTALYQARKLARLTNLFLCRRNCRKGKPKYLGAISGESRCLQADLNGDEQINFYDILLLQKTHADLDGDGITGNNDLKLILACWGATGLSSQSSSSSSGCVVNSSLTSGISSSSASSQLAHSVSQYGITWTFDKEYPVGQFATGDWWVLGPVRVLSVDPAPSTISQTDLNGANSRNFQINGSMANPSWVSYGGNSQGYDERIGLYSSTASLFFPYEAAVNTSIVSTRSWLKGEAGCPMITSTLPYAPRPSIRDAAVLTVLPAPASETALRPPYFGTWKPIYDSTEISLADFPVVPAAASMPSVAAATGWIQRAWIDHGKTWQSDYWHPSNNIPDHWPANMAAYHGDVSLMLLSSGISPHDKLALAKYMAQIGLDMFAVLRGGGIWGENGGGHSHARKWPILLAGILLNDAGMKAIGTTESSGCKFEDSQVFRVTQEDIDRFPYSVTRTNCTVSASTPNKLVDNDGGDWTVKDGGGHLKNRGPLQYWIEWQGGYERIAGYEGSTLTLWNPVPAAANQTAVIRVFPQARLGELEWTNRHCNWPSTDDEDRSYLITTHSYAGQILAARMLHAVELWNHPVIFDWVDWYVEHTKWWTEQYPGDAWERIRTPFSRAMWDMYR